MVRAGTGVLVPLTLTVVMTLLHPETGELHQVAETFPISDNIYRPMLDGYREGDDARDVLSDALAWWSKELDAIDATVGTLRRPDQVDDAAAAKTRGS